jgi:DnaJ-like protein
MTGRKPGGVSWESWVEGQIREGMERGEFDDLPGAGKPLRDTDQPHDEMWWIREKLRREDVSILPPALAVRRDLEDALDRIAKADTESAVRQIVDAVNERIVQVNSRTTSGPPTSVMPLNVDRVIQEWRNRRS